MFSLVVTGTAGVEAKEEVEEVEEEGLGRARVSTGVKMTASEDMAAAKAGAEENAETSAAADLADATGL